MKKLRLFLANVGRRHALYPLATPPMGILALAAYLRTKFDLEIKVVNQRAENFTYAEVARQAVEFEADIVGLSALTPFGYALGGLTRAIRQARRNALIVLGGPHCSAFGERVLEGTAANAAVVGEGERSFEQVIEAYFGGGGLADIPGLIWRDADGEVLRNPGVGLVFEDLDALPFPAYDLIDVTAYWKLQSMPPVPRRKYISLVSSRGCPYHCMWCHKVFGKRFRAHSAERIVDEIQHYVRAYGVDDVEFLDDIFNLDPDRVIQFAELMARRNLRVKIAFPNAVRTDILTEEVVEALVDTGMYFSSFALESGSPRVQRFTGKNLDIPRFLKGIEMAVKRGVFANGFMMLGFPTETAEEMQETIDVARDSMLHTASFFAVTPYPNTRLHEYVKKTQPEKLTRISYDDTDLSHAPVNLSAVSDKTLMRYLRKAQRDFFFHPKRLYRIVRNFPQPHLLPLYLPIFLDRLLNGLFSSKVENVGRVQQADGAEAPHQARDADSPLR